MRRASRLCDLAPRTARCRRLLAPARRSADCGRHRVRCPGLDWTFAPVPRDWASTQWLSELLLYWVHVAGGWAALAWFRVLTTAIAIATTAWTTLRGRPLVLAGFPFVVSVVAIAFVSQERPQQATLIGAAILGGVLLDGVDRVSAPSLVPTPASDGRVGEPPWWLGTCPFRPGTSRAGQNPRFGAGRSHGPEGLCPEPSGSGCRVR